MSKDSLKVWYEYGKADKLSFERLFDDDFTIRLSLFHAQQAVEKWLKLLALISKIQFNKTHDLVLLLNIISEKHPELVLPNILDSCSALNFYGVEARYPGAVLDIDELNADKLIAINLLEILDKYIISKYSKLIG